MKKRSTGQRLPLPIAPTADRQEMLRILRGLEWRRTGGRAPAATPQAASAKKYPPRKWRAKLGKSDHLDG